jgi:hypothetical protein
MKLSQTLAKKTLAVSASLALALGGALAFTGSAQAVDATGTTLTFEADDAIGTAAGASGAFEGGAAEIAASPAGHAGKVLKFTKSGQAWSGVNLVLPDSNLRITTGDLPVVTMDVWSGATAATPVMFKLQSAGGWPGSHNCLKAVEVQPGWNFLSFDMSTAKCIDTDNGWAGESYQTGVSYIVAAVFPNFGADDTTYTGAAAEAVNNQIYLIDNVQFNTAAASAPTAKITGPSKKVLRVEVANAAGKQVTVKIPGVRNWTSSGVFGAGSKTLNFTVPSGTYKVTVTVGHKTVVKTQVVK